MSFSRSSHRLLSRLALQAAQILSTVRRHGADHATVRLDHGHSLRVGVRDGVADQVCEAQTLALSLRVVRGGRTATLTTSDLRPEVLSPQLARVVALTEWTQVDPYTPPSPLRLARRWPELDLYDGALRRFDSARALRLAQLAEAVALQFDPRIESSGGAQCSRTIDHGLLATSAGFVGPSAGTRVALRAQVIAAADGVRRSGHYWSGGRHLVSLDPPERVGRETARRALRSLGAQPVASGVYPVVFAPEAAAGVIALVASCLVGEVVAQQRSYLTQRLGTQVASRLVTLIDDPWLIRGAASRGFDGEGLPTERSVVVDRGRLCRYLQTSNFYLQAGEHAPEAVIAGVGQGLYVHALLGQGGDIGRGRLSCGIEGLWIADGRLTVPVGEVTISCDLDAMLHNIDAVANDLVLRTAVAAPSLRVAAVAVGGR